MFNRIRWQRGDLWRHADFLFVWAAETIANFGGQISLFAIPLIAAITLGASPFEMGLLAAAGRAPQLVIGLIAGAWIDRLPRRPIMVVTSLGQMATSAIIPVAALSGQFRIGLLILTTVLTGIFSVFYNTAWGAMLPNLVERKHLTDATSKLMGSGSLAQVMGPALGGIIVAAIGGPGAMWITVVTFALSAWLLSRMRGVEARPDRSAHAASMWSDVREGLHELWREPVVRALMNSAVVLNFGGFVFLSVYVLFMTNDLGLSSQGIGLVYAAGGVGALIGAVIAPRLAQLLGVGPSILWSAVAFGAANLPVPLAFYLPSVALPAVVIAEACSWMAIMVFNVNRFALRQAVTPDHLRGRIGASSVTMISGAILLGSLAGGSIGQVLSVHAALYVGIVIMALAAIWVWRSPVPGIIAMPDEETGPGIATEVG